MTTEVVKRRRAAQAAYADFCAAARAAEHLAQAGVTRCAPIEPLPPGFRGGWITSPANIVHMVREPDAW